MSWLFEGSCFVVKDLRKVFDKIVSSGFPYSWRGKGSGYSPHSFGPKEILYVVYHQTYGGITPGEEGPKRTGNFLVANPKFRCKNPDCKHEWTGSPKYPSTKCPKCATQGKDLGYGRGFPKTSYHVFVPFRPQYNENGKAIIYYLVDFQEGTWHSGRANKHGVAVGFQGRFHHPSMKYFRPTKGTDGEPSEDQKRVCMALWHEWIYPQLQATKPKLMGHWEWGKTACPGGWIQSQILISRGEEPLKGYEEVPAGSDWIPPKPIWTSSELFDTHEERQAALVLLGYDLGPYGKHKNGVDGDWGEMSRGALESFEKEAGISENGYWDEETEEAMKRVFKENELTADHIKAVIKGENPLAEKPAVVTLGESITELAPPKPEETKAEEATATATASVSVEAQPVEQVDDPEDPPPYNPKTRKRRKLKKKPS